MSVRTLVGTFAGGTGGWGGGLAVMAGMVAGAGLGAAASGGVGVGGGDGDEVEAADVDSFDENSACTSVGHQLRGHISLKLFIEATLCRQHDLVMNDQRWTVKVVMSCEGYNPRYVCRSCHIMSGIFSETKQCPLDASHFVTDKGKCNQ